jgi:hypothetical protein
MVDYLIKAAQQAIKTLEFYRTSEEYSVHQDSPANVAIAALRAALEQPIPESFDEWWNSDILSEDNPFSKESPAYWAWEGWQAHQRCAASKQTEGSE